MLNNKICKQSVATASQVHRDIILPDQVNIAHFRYFETQLFDIFRHNNFTSTKRASVENRLLWRNAIRSSLLYSDFRYTMELPL